MGLSSRPGEKKAESYANRSKTCSADFLRKSYISTSVSPRRGYSSAETLTFLGSVVRTGCLRQETKKLRWPRQISCYMNWDTEKKLGSMSPKAQIHQGDFF